MARKTKLKGWGNGPARQGALGLRLELLGAQDGHNEVDQAGDGKDGDD
jgi:hypothetical protein